MKIFIKMFYNDSHLKDNIVTNPTPASGRGTIYKLN